MLGLCGADNSRGSNRHNRRNEDATPPYEWRLTGQSQPPEPDPGSGISGVNAEWVDPVGTTSRIRGLDSSAQTARHVILPGAATCVRGSVLGLEASRDPP